MQDSSPIILIYALCGKRSDIVFFIVDWDEFLIGVANFDSMGVTLATLGVFAPARKLVLTKITPRTLIAGNMVPLMIASIAGIEMRKCYIFLFSLLFI